MNDPGVDAPTTEYGPDGEITILPPDFWWECVTTTYNNARDLLWWEYEMRQPDQARMPARKYRRTVTGKVTKNSPKQVS